jgi:diketogulonate reductase-like aldo/keto reductase
MENRSLGRGRVSVPVVALGTWRRLEAAAAAGRHRELIDTPVSIGIRLVDTSPMYGAAQLLVADALDGKRDQVVVADKVWTPSREEGVAQLARAVDWYGGGVDLMQIHNLVAWRAHLPMLEAARAAGLVRLIGASCSCVRSARVGSCAAGPARPSWRRCAPSASPSGCRP